MLELQQAWCCDHCLREPIRCLRQKLFLLIVWRTDTQSYVSRMDLLICFTELLRSEEASGDNIVCPHPPLKQGQLEQVAQDHVQSSFEYLYRWRLKNLSTERKNRTIHSPRSSVKHVNNSKVPNLLFMADRIRQQNFMKPFYSSAFQIKSDVCCFCYQAEKMASKCYQHSEGHKIFPGVMERQSCQEADGSSIKCICQQYR